MEFTIQLPQDVSVRMPEEETPVRVVLAYENSAGFQVTAKIYHRVVQSLTGRFKFRENWLSFSTFTEPLSLERAVNLAAEAEMVFCCPGNPFLLPGPAQDWMRLWLMQRRQPDSALVLLLPVIAGSISHQTLLERDLHATARAAGLTFFANEYVADLDSQSLAMKILFACEGDFDASGVLQGDSNARDWSINE